MSLSGAARMCILLVLTIVHQLHYAARTNGANIGMLCAQGTWYRCLYVYSV